MKDAALESDARVIIRAPLIRLAGRLVTTGVDGLAGEGAMHGNFRILEGGLKADRDLIAGADSITSAGGLGDDSIIGSEINGGEFVSLLDHLHTGVMRGISLTDFPRGGGGGGWTGADDPPQAGRDIIERLRDVTADPVEKTILCLPDIADAQATRADNVADAQGWLYLRDMLKKWLNGPAIRHPMNNPEPFFVDWDWVMSFARAREAYRAFTSLEGVGGRHNIYNNASQNQIVKYLQLDGKFTNKTETFDYIALPWKERDGRYFNFHSVDRVPVVDGLSAALAGFTFRALAKGNVEPNGSGGHIITVTHVGVYVDDRFAFQEGESFYYWNCESKSFKWHIAFPWEGFHALGGTDFLRLQEKYNIGKDFLVLSDVHNVEDFQRMRYEQP